jgi:hypothetical protein
LYGKRQLKAAEYGSGVLYARVTTAEATATGSATAGIFKATAQRAAEVVAETTARGAAQIIAKATVITKNVVSSGQDVFADAARRSRAQAAGSRAHTAFKTAERTAAQVNTSRGAEIAASGQAPAETTIEVGAADIAAKIVATRQEVIADAPAGRSAQGAAAVDAEVVADAVTARRSTVDAGSIHVSHIPSPFVSRTAVVEIEPRGA